MKFYFKEIVYLNRVSPLLECLVWKQSFPSSRWKYEKESFPTKEENLYEGLARAYSNEKLNCEKLNFQRGTGLKIRRVNEH